MSSGMKPEIPELSHDDIWGDISYPEPVNPDLLSRIRNLLYIISAIFMFFMFMFIPLAISLSFRDIIDEEISRKVHILIFGSMLLTLLTAIGIHINQFFTSSSVFRKTLSFLVSCIALVMISVAEMAWSSLIIAPLQMFIVPPLVVAFILMLFIKIYKKHGQNIHLVWLAGISLSSMLATIYAQKTFDHALHTTMLNGDKIVDSLQVD